MRASISIFFFTACIYFHFPGFAQDIHFKVVPSSQDETGFLIAGMTQDAQGFLWLATQIGLFRYDGNKYISYHHEPSNSNSPAGDNIWCIASDKAGYVWFSSGGMGLDRLDPATGLFTHFQHRNNDSGSLGNDTVLTILPDHEGTIWIGTYSGLDRFDGKSNTFSHYQFNANDASSLSCNVVRAVYEDKQGTIWVGTGTAYQGYDDCGGLNKLNRETGKFTRYLHDEKDPHSLIDNKVRAIFEDSRGVFWVGTAGDGLHTMDRAKGTFERHLYDPLQPDKLSRPPVKKISRDVADHITFIFEDHKGRIWIGTMKAGINVYDPSTQKVTYYGADSNSKQKLGNNDFLAACKTTDNVIWIGEYLSEGVGSGNFYKILPNKNVLPYKSIGKTVRAFAEDGAFTLWMGTRNGLIHITSDGKEEQFLIDKDSSHAENHTGNIEKDDNKFWLPTRRGLYLFDPDTKIFSGYFHQEGNVNGLLSNDVRVVKKTTGNGLWIGGVNGLDLMNTKSGKFTHFQNKLNDTVSISSNVIFAIAIDKKQNIWVGTDKGLNRLDLQTGLFKKYLNQSIINCIIEDCNGTLWCATNAGIFKYDKEKDNFPVVTDEVGIISPSLLVYWITEDNEQNLWLTTRKGLIEMNKEGSMAVLYGKNQGVNGPFLSGYGYARRNGELLFGNTSGYFHFKPWLLKQNVLPPVLTINNFLVNNAIFQPSAQGILPVPLMKMKEIRLLHNQNTFSFEFSNIDFISEQEDTRIIYMLQNYDKAWRKAGDEKAANYFNVPPGNYVFKVKAFNAAGLAATKEIRVSVTPPWWKTGWAYTAYLLITILAIRAYLRFTVNRAKLKSQLLFERNEAKRAKELDQVKTQLYTNITHEFRTPLTVILGMARQIVSKPDEYLKTGTDMILRNGENLLKLVSEMLDLSKLESGKVSLQLIQGDVIIFLRYVVESFHSLAQSQQKQLHFLCHIDSLNTAYDPEKMRQIVANLLSNALKFTPEKGNIYISINESNPAGKEDRSFLIIKVKDTGMGIAEEQVPYIFDRFYQSDNSSTRKTEGTGIGLALTKELVKLMEGEISVKSPPPGANKGSEFVVILPFTRVTDEPVITYPHPIAIGSALVPQQNINSTTGTAVELTGEVTANGNQLILMVEDNADVVDYTASCLTDYRLAVGKDGREGLEIATTIIPDLIITDVMMPIMDGFELCHQLRNDERTSHIPIIMLTAKSDMASKLEGLERGADVYLEKPFNREELLLRIKKLLELRKSLQQYYGKKAGLTDQPVTIPTPVDENIAGLTDKADTRPTPVDNKIEDAFVKKVREAVAVHLADYNFTVEQLCKYVFMSHSQLHRKLEALTGCSPNKFIRIHRLNKAKELLKVPGNSIASIAAECGYNDPAYFSRVFKQEYNITPMEWRVRFREELT